MEKIKNKGGKQKKNQRKKQWHKRKLIGKALKPKKKRL